MSSCGCGAGSSCACGNVDELHGAALSVGGSIGSLLAMLTAAVSIGPSATTHARNATNAALGLPYVGRGGELVTSSGSVPVGYGLELTDPDAPRVGRSGSWRMCPLPVRAAVGVELGGGDGQ